MVHGCSANNMSSPFPSCYSIQPPRWLLSLPVWRNRRRIPDHPESQLLHPHAVPGWFWWRLAAVPADAQPGLRGPLARPRLQPHDTGRQHAHALALCGPGAANPRHRSGAGFVGEWDSDTFFSHGPCKDQTLKCFASGPCTLFRSERKFYCFSSFLGTKIAEKLG